MDKYSRDNVAHEDFAYSIADEVVVNENCIFSNNEYVTHEKISSPTFDEESTIDGDTAFKNIKEDFDSSIINDVDDAYLTKYQFDDTAQALSVIETCMHPQRHP